MKKRSSKDRRKKRRTPFQVGHGVERRKQGERRAQLQFNVQLDATESRRRRDEGMAQVEANEPPPWKERYELLFRDWRMRRCRDGTCAELFKFEDFRDYASQHIDAPHHPNCWGPASKRMRHLNLCFNTGGMDQAHAAKSKSTWQPTIQLTCERCKRHELELVR